MTRNLEIRIRGTLPPDAAERLGLTAAVEPAETFLRGPVVDGAALQGVLDRLRCNRMELLDVRRLPDRDEDSP